MKYEKVEQFSEVQFRRITGVKRATFEKMVELVHEKQKEKQKKGGRPNKLSVEDMVLMTLEYLREYRTYLHIAGSYGLSESNVFQCIRWVESILINSKEFKLPGRKVLLKSDNEIEVILIDATESPIERPKKNSVGSIQARKKDIRSKRRSL